MQLVFAASFSSPTAAYLGVVKLIKNSMLIGVLSALLVSLVNVCSCLLSSGDSDGAHVEKSTEAEDHGIPTTKPFLLRGGADADGGP